MAKHPEEDSLFNAADAMAQAKKYSVAYRGGVGWDGSDRWGDGDGVTDNGGLIDSSEWGEYSVF